MQRCMQQSRAPYLPFVMGREDGAGVPVHLLVALRGANLIHWELSRARTAPQLLKRVGRVQSPVLPSALSA